MKKSIIGMVVLTMVTLSSALVGAQDDKLPAPRINTRPVAPPSDATHWTYEGEKGPQFWGKLDPDFSLCADGHSQSPVDIVRTSPASLPKLRAKFSPANLRIVHHEHMADEINNGHTIQVNYSEGDTITLGDTDYELIQFHFHTPSEHTVHGKHYPMEMHFVHKSPSGALAVIGLRRTTAADTLIHLPRPVARHFAITSSITASDTVTRWCKGCTGRLFPSMSDVNLQICAAESWMGDCITSHFTPSEQGGVVSEPS